MLMVKAIPMLSGRKTGCLPAEELGDFLRARKSSKWSSAWAAGRRGGREKSAQRENQDLLEEVCSERCGGHGILPERPQDGLL